MRDDAPPTETDAADPGAPAPAEPPEPPAPARPPELPHELRVAWDGLGVYFAGTLAALWLWQTLAPGEPAKASSDAAQTPVPGLPLSMDRNDPRLIVLGLVLMGLLLGGLVLLPILVLRLSRGGAFRRRLPEVPWGLWGAAHAAAAVLFIQTLTVMLIIFAVQGRLTAAWPGLVWPSRLGALGLAALLGAGYVWQLARRRYRALPEELGLGAAERARPLRALGLGALGYLAAAPALWGLLWAGAALARNWGYRPRAHPLLEGMAVTRSWLPVWGVLLVVLAPLVEELVFRGVLYPALRRRLGVLGGMLLSGFFFAVIHPEPTQIPALLILGAWAAWLYERSGSLLAPIGLHATNNLVTLLIFALLPTAGGG